MTPRWPLRYNRFSLLNFLGQNIQIRTEIINEINIPGTNSNSYHAIQCITACLQSYKKCIVPTTEEALQTWILEKTANQCEWELLSSINPCFCKLDKSTMYVHTNEVATDINFVQPQEVLHVHSWALFLKNLCFLKKESNFGRNFQWIRLEMFKRTKKSQIHFSRAHGCEVNVKNV